MAGEIIGEGGLFVGGYVCSHSRLYFTILDIEGVLSVYAGEGPDDPSKYKVWDTGNKVPDGYQVNKLAIRKGPLDNSQKKMQILISLPPPRGGLRELWASGGSSDLTSPMEGLVADDGNLYLRQNNKTIWDNGFHDSLLESVVSDLKYDVKNIRRMPKGDPIRIEIPGAPNNTDTPQTTTLTLKHSQSTTHMWTDKIGTTFGVKATSTIDVPFIGSASVEVSASVTNEFTWGKSYSDTKELDATVNLTVPPHKKYKAWMEVQEMDYELPFTTTGTFRFKSGKQVTRTISGIYKGVSGDRGQVGWDDITDARNPKNVFTAKGADVDRILAGNRV